MANVYRREIDVLGRDRNDHTWLNTQDMNCMCEGGREKKRERKGSVKGKLKTRDGKGRGRNIEWRG